MSQKQANAFSSAIKSVVGVVLIAAASAGAALFYQDYAQLGGAHADPAPAPTPAPDPIFSPLEPFTVTLNSEDMTRILYVAVTLRLADSDSAAVINTYMPEVRDRALRLLSEQLPETVQTPDGRAKLVSGLQTTLSQPYEPAPKPPKITDVLFTAFVVQ
ncbi:flagellar basal body-associated protein FliL [Allopusillimonas soli]|uniref:Flagellar protein FliL n=1 Tax=Allopusillimonas soli TaxID=659016 RepID=A0A853F995_9BURK|nr:flagellar basal body-associated protein FliL [Allopusillimonas soli]NYT35510.1 flagellar basal body-associated protein FliL [Allopusillimonas soli]